MESLWDRAADVVRGGGVVAVPTDTVWGLVCRADDAGAVERVYVIKHRNARLELPLLGACMEHVEPFVSFNPTAARLAATFWPGPLTLVLPCVDARSALAIPRAGNSLAVRIPDHRSLRALLAVTGPLASTSANRHGVAAATTAVEVRSQLGKAIDLVVDAVAQPGGVSSTIVDCTAEPATVIRVGAVDPSLLEHPL